MTIHSSDKLYVTWRSLAPIFADVLVSPWNLLVGGLLSHYLPFETALLSLFVGYLLLATTMLIYGSLGFRLRKRTYAIIEPIFGERGANYFFSILLAFGQIGWFGVISEIGGVSLASIFHLSPTFGVILYCVVMILMASLKLHQLGIVKALIVASSITLMFYLLVAKGATTTIESVLTYQPRSSHAVIWGIGAVFSSLISFTSVSPDFLSQARSRSDTVISVGLGVLIPGILVGTLGIIIFYDFPSLQMAALIGGLALPLFGNVFNIITNTDAAIAIYTPGLAFSHVLKTTHWRGVLVGGTIGTILAVSGIAENLEVWLTFLSAVYPAIIGLTLSYYYFPIRHGRLEIPAKNIDWRSISIILLALLGALVLDLSFLGWLSLGVSFILSILVRALLPAPKQALE